VALFSFVDKSGFFGFGGGLGGGFGRAATKKAA
jgi:hypothetical protein